MGQRVPYIYKFSKKKTFSYLCFRLMLSTALFISFLALLNPLDEVILIEPFYDSYPAAIAMAGAVSRCVPLCPPASTDVSNANDWDLDLNELRAAITSRTRMLVINNPQNIPGKVYTLEELKGVAEIAKQHDLLVISDEVYEPFLYDHHVHRKIAAIPGMFDRTLTIGSAGKMFSVTGWKTGWVIGPARLLQSVSLVHQHSTFCCTTPLQEALAIALGQCAPDGPHGTFLVEQRRTLQARRDRLCSVLSEFGLNPVVPCGSYFVLADTSRIPDNRLQPDDHSPRDHRFSRWLTMTARVASIPPSEFYSPEHKAFASNFTRFCFCKKEETLANAERRLKEALSSARI